MTAEIPEKSDQPRSHTAATALATIALFVLAAAVFVGLQLAPPSEPYAVETYRARFADEPAGLRLLGYEEADPQRTYTRRADGSIEAGGVATINAEVKILRLVPLNRSRRGWHEFEHSRQPSYEAVARASSDFGVQVRLSSVSDLMTTNQDARVTVWVWPAAESTPMVVNQTIPEEKVRQILPLLADDVAFQSGKPEYAEPVRKGGTPPLSAPVVASSILRPVLYVILPGAAFVVSWLLLRFFGRRETSTA